MKIQKTSVFEERLGAYKGPSVSFMLELTVAPIQMKPHCIIFTLCPKADAEIDYLVKHNVLAALVNLS